MASMAPRQGCDAACHSCSRFVERLRALAAPGTGAFHLSASRCRVDLRGSGFAELWFSGFPFRRFCAFVARLVVRRDQIDVTDAKRAGEMKQRHDGRVAPSSFEIAHILLREARDLGETLLGEALLPAKSPEIPAHELAHVHMRTLGLYIL